MKYIIKFFHWELKNEFKTCGYFCVMLCCYGIVEYLYGRPHISTITILQMFLLNYGISTMQNLILKENIKYDAKTYYRKACFLSCISIVIIVVFSRILRWFEHSSIYGELFMYLSMISAYLFVWCIERIAKRYDTKQLNEQLQRFKEENKEE